MNTPTLADLFTAPKATHPVVRAIEAEAVRWAVSDLLNLPDNLDDPLTEAVHALVKTGEIEQHADPTGAGYEVYGTGSGTVTVRAFLRSLPYADDAILPLERSYHLPLEYHRDGGLWEGFAHVRVALVEAPVKAVAGGWIVEAKYKWEVVA